MYTHKIIFRKSGNQSTVSCDCRAVLGKHTREKGGGEYFEPMPVQAGETFFDTYNRPENHYAPFTEQDKIPT